MGAFSDLLYVGTYNEKHGSGSGPWGCGDGIHIVAFDPVTGAIRSTQGATPARNPSFLALDRNASRPYCVEELGTSNGRAAGAVCAFGIDRSTGKLHRLGWAETSGRHPCHVTIDPSGRTLAVANYTCGGTALFSIGPDGALTQAATIVNPPGSGPQPERQATPHPHAVAIDPTSRHMYVTDLGADAIYLYRLLSTGAGLSFDPVAIKMPTSPAAGPRQMVLCPTGTTAYVLNELTSSIAVHRRDQESGALLRMQILPTLPAGWAGISAAAELQITPDGLHVYASNRGHDSLAIFARDPGNGLLAARGHASTLGRTPRSFAVHPLGRWLVAANQASDELVVFARDQRTGALRANGARIRVGSPVCPRFL